MFLDIIAKILMWGTLCLIQYVSNEDWILFQT